MMIKWQLLFLNTLTLGCSQASDKSIGSYQSAPELSAYKQVTFTSYINETERWLRKNRMFISENPEQELSNIMPFEYIPSKATNKGVLLVHGLSDTPFSFIDIAESLVQKGYHVRAVLLTGHGSKPGDLLLADSKQWHDLVQYHVELMSQEVDELWLGGFSTGANLVTSEAYDNPDVEGLLLFSPAFKPKSNFIRFSSFVSNFIDWFERVEETNPVQYESLTFKGAAAYYDTSVIVKNKLANEFSKPVFLVLAEQDSVIDTSYVLETFNQKLTNPRSKLIWYGDAELDYSDRRMQSYSMKLPLCRISSASHMGVLYKPENTYYGRNGEMKICDNGFSSSDAERCFNGEETWYSAWGYTEGEKLYARLTWNPYYDEMLNKMLEVMTTP